MPPNGHFVIFQGYKGRIDLNPFESNQATLVYSIDTWKMPFLGDWLAKNDIFCALNGWNDLNPFASSQATSGTGLEYPHGILWCNLKITSLVAWAECPKLVIFKFHQSMPCGYSKLVSEGAWQDAKGMRSIRPLNPEKTSKMCWKHPKR